MSGHELINFNVFWYGANGCEFVSLEGSTVIFVYPTETYPKPPTQAIITEDPINSMEDFKEALNSSEYHDIEYRRMLGDPPPQNQTTVEGDSQEVKEVLGFLFGEDRGEHVYSFSHEYALCQHSPYADIRLKRLQPTLSTVRLHPARFKGVRWYAGKCEVCGSCFYRRGKANEL